MFCPKCATQNLEGASFCRTCGANISLVPQALTGQMVQPPVEEVADSSCVPRGRRRPLTLDVAFKNIFIGVAFFIISIALSRTIGAGWWFWMLIPAFLMIGGGLARYMQIRRRERAQFGESGLAASGLSGVRINALPDRSTEFINPASGYRTGDLVPPSVTESTTRHLEIDTEGQTMSLPQK